MPKLKIEKIVSCPRLKDLVHIEDCERECWFFNKRWGDHIFCNYGLKPSNKTGDKFRGSTPKANEDV